MTKETKTKTQSKSKKTKSSTKKVFFKILEEKFMEITTQALKQGVINYTSSKISEAEEKIKNKVEKKIMFHFSKVLKSILFILGGLFLTYALIEIIIQKLNSEISVNLIFALILLLAGLVLHLIHRK